MVDDGHISIMIEITFTPLPWCLLIPVQRPLFKATTWTHLVPAFAIGRYFVEWGKKRLPSMVRTYSSRLPPAPVRINAKLFLDYYLSPSAWFLAARQKDWRHGQSRR
jgi:hypothetical protein